MQLTFKTKYVSVLTFVNGPSASLERRNYIILREISCILKVDKISQQLGPLYLFSVTFFLYLSNRRTVSLSVFILISFFSINVFMHVS